MLDAAALQVRARAATNAGRHVQAAALARRGLTRDPDAVQRARLLATLAYAESELGHLDLAETLCSEALELAGVDDTTRGTVHGQRAVVLLRRGHTDRALADFGAAIRSLTGDPASLGRQLLNRGNLYLEAGDARRALADFERAVTESDAGGLPGQGAKARHNAGYAAFLLGDHVRALTSMDAVAQELAGSATSRAIGLQDRAEVLAAAGLRGDAIADLRHAITLFRAGRARRAEAAAELALARTLVIADPRTALALARRASARFATMGAELSRLRADALVAAAARSARLRTVPDIAPLVSALRERGLHDDAGSLAIAECSWLLARGRLDAAAAVRLPRSSRRRPDAWAAYVTAERQAALGRRAAALATVRRALDESHAVRSGLGSLELQASSTDAATHLGRLGLALALRRGDPGLVLEWSERTRAASSRIVAVRPPADAQQADDLTELRTLQAYGRDTARQDDLRRRIRERAWQVAGSHAAQPVCRLEDLQRGLGSQAASLVALLADDTTLTALVVHPEGATLVPLGARPPVDDLLAGLPADLDVAATDLPAAIASRVRAGLADRLARLDAALLAPLAPHLAGRRVVLTPSGPFARVPWPLLPTLAGRPVTVARSATAWLSTPAAAPAPTRALFVAGPGLARAEDELAACARHWTGPTTLVGVGATVGATARAVAHADVVHLAAHGRHEPQNPLFSHVQLADGPAYGYELDRVRPMPAVMVLSACEVGGHTASDDPLGLATALLHAGARTVLASPAALSDDAAAAVMPELHGRLAAGEAAWDALAATLAAHGPAAPPLVCFGAGW